MYSSKYGWDTQHFIIAIRYDSIVVAAGKNIIEKKKND